MKAELGKGVVMNKLVLVGLIGLCAILGLAQGKVVNCYYGTWANYRPGDGKFTPENIDANLCTHLSYSFFGITANGELKTLDSWLDIDLKNIAKSMALKQQNPKLKVILTVGGWNEGSINYSNLAADPSKRKRFIDTSLQYIKQYGFDGMDLDWEYPAQRGGSSQDKVNFVTLLKELRAAFQPYNLELSIAVGASATTASISYDIPNIAKYVNYINVMTYDFATAGDGRVGFNAPLKGQGENNVQSAIQYWLKQGAPAKQLVLGLAFYGRAFTLSNPQQTTVGSPITGAGNAGPITREPGFLGYNEICAVEKQWTSKWSSEHEVPYMYNGNQWVGFDNPKSIGMKVDYANSLNLAGVMLWSIETDDFLGKCGPKFPLLKAINNKMGNPQTSEPSAPSPSYPVPAPAPSPVPAPAPSTPSKDDGNCSVDGFYANASDCSRYYQCAGRIRYDFVCPSGLLFDTSASTCNWANQVQC